MIDRQIEIAARALDVAPATLSADTVFAKHRNWDSFAALALVYGIEEAYGVLLGYGALGAAKTLGEVADLVQARLSLK